VSSIKEFNIPDEAITFIVTNYLKKKSVESVSLTVGIPSNTVEDIITLFFQWADRKSLVEDSKLTIDLEEY
jgi:Zn finger protein HypA/HybF involved in hydrogenase expression